VLDKELRSVGFKMFRKRSHRALVNLAHVCVTLALFACTTVTPNTQQFRADVDWDVITNLPRTPVSFTDQVQPVLNARCTVCHGCYDAPCQLKLTSFEGVARGASPVQVYDGARILAAQPTRLGVDATSVEEWRALGFHRVLSSDGGEAPPSGETADPATTADLLRSSPMYRMLRLKQRNPQPQVGLLPKSITTGLDRAQTCTTIEDFDAFADKHPTWGMPYGMPNLTRAEYATLVSWLAQGAPPPAPAEPSVAAREQIVEWETLLNGSSLKDALISRYLYEHLFLAHLHLAGAPDREFYRLVRSTTPPGQSIQEIPTRRPYGDPGADRFWYRLKLLDEAIVAKSHVPYELSPAKLARYRALFFDADFTVSELPSYDLETASNPFVAFRDIPPDARYRFLLDDARFFIMGFIKGPVCRGQIALNVIEDQFWVVFTAPDAPLPSNDADFLDQVADYMQMPAKDTTFRLLAAYQKFHKGQEKYLDARMSALQQAEPRSLQQAMQLIWDGAGTNPNAALTIFRNFDSAAVEYGLKGDYPETAWIVTYPQLERIHYLLVAGFDVFGNVGHQLNTRLFMDFLRMEGEDHFLTLLPPAARQAEHARWYEGVRNRRKKYFQEPAGWMQQDLITGYRTDHPKHELYQAIEAHLGLMAGPVDYLNRCVGSCTTPGVSPAEQKVDAAMRQIASIRGAQLQVFPDVTFVRIERTDSGGLPYTLIYNKGYANITSFLEDASSANRDTSQDTMTVLKGFSGAYPNFFFSVPEDRVDDFVTRVRQVDSMDAYNAVVALYGVRRTDRDFWTLFDWMQSRYRQEAPIESGIFDLNRYANR